MKDKLDTLLNLLDKSDKSKRYGNVFEDMLYTISNNNDAFFFLYESMPEGMKPNLNTCSENFRSTFLDVIKREDETTFNSYFFSGMHKHFDVDTIRELQFKFPTNEKLKEYWKSIDNPKNIDQVIELVAELWLNKSVDYEPTLNFYLDDFQKLNKIKSEKSRAADRFAWWGRCIHKEEGLQGFFKLCEKIKVEPLTFFYNTKNSLHLYIQHIPLNDLKFLLDYSDKLVNSSQTRFQYSFQAFESTLSGKSIIYSLKELVEDNGSESLEKFSLIWKTQQEYIKESFKDISCMKYNIKDNASLQKVLKLVMENDFEYNDWSSKLQLNKSNLEKIIKYGFIADLDLPEKNMIEPKKLKL